MIKKVSLVGLVMMLALLPLAGQGKKAEDAPKAAGDPRLDIVTKMYTLKYVSPVTVRDTLRGFVFDFNHSEGSNIITVSMRKSNVADFEEGLRKLDVQKKTIQFRIFAVIASRGSKPDAIENPDLKKVLNELSKLLSFKSYSLEGASSLTLKDWGNGEVPIGTNPLRICRIDEVRLVTDNTGKRSIQFQFRMMQMLAENKMMTVLESNTEVAENGYLVAGVSKIDNGDSLVLVINAEIK